MTLSFNLDNKLVTRVLKLRIMVLEHVSNHAVSFINVD